MEKPDKREKKEIIIPEARDFKGIWIPGRLYLARNLTPNEKFVLIEIYSLTKNKSRQCFASNKHFADFVGLKENTIQKMMLKLENAGYIKRFYERKENSKEIERRIIILTNQFYESFVNESEEPMSDAPEQGLQCDGFNSIGGGGKKSSGVVDKKSEISNTNIKYNNTRSNTDINAFNSKELKEDNINASFPEKKRTQTPFLDMNNCTPEEIEKHYSIRCKKIAQKHNITDAEKIRDAAKTISYFCQKYYAVFREDHPVLSDRALERVFINFCFPPELLDENGITTFGHYEEMIDRYFATEYGKYNLSGIVPDYSISHFMSDEILTNLCKNVFGIPHL